MASPTGIIPNPNLNPNQNQNQNLNQTQFQLHHHQQQHQQQQAAGGGHFDMQKLYKPSSSSSLSPTPSPPPISPNINLNTTPSLPSSSSPSSSSYPTTSSSSYPPPTGPSYPFHPQYLPYHHQQHLNHHLPNISMQPPTQQQRPISYAPTSPNSNITGGARLMALLSNQKPPDLQSTATVPFSSSATSSPQLPPDFSVSSSSSTTTPSAPPLSLATQQNPTTATPMRLPSRKVPRGRHLIGERVVYDIDVRLLGEVQPQLEVTPITKYGSDPGLVLGRQIAVNKSYICYGLKLGAIRVLDINTALRALLRGHNQRVTDMAFFAEDVHLLASASVDGRVFIWRIAEGPDEEDKPQITGKIVVAIQIVGEGKPVHPRLCWHPHKQEILVFAIENRILKIDTTKIGKGKMFSAEEPLKCPLDKLVDGVQLVGNHDGEITELSMCQWMKSRLASASVDGTVKIWEDRKAPPIAVLRPHDGQPVNSVTFLTAPHRPDHIVLITAGPLNREVKMWASESEEGWLLPSDTESWQCTQTLYIMSSAETKAEDAFFNQVVALPRAGLFLLANAKKNAIYVVHIEYGSNPTATRMDYIAEFTVTMPILSLTGTSDSLPDGDLGVQVYCVQTQAIQQYALDLSQCLPPPIDNTELEKANPSASQAFDASDGSAVFESLQTSEASEISVGNLSSMPYMSSESSLLTVQPVKLASSDPKSLPDVASSGINAEPIPLPSHSGIENLHPPSPPLPLSPRLSRNLSGFRSSGNSIISDHGSDQSILVHSFDQRMDSVKDNNADTSSSRDNQRKGDKNGAEDDNSVLPSSSAVFKRPTHLVTPSEILAVSASSSENSQFGQGMGVVEAKVQDIVISNDADSIEKEVKVIGEMQTGNNIESDVHGEAQVIPAEKKEKSFYSQASGLSFQVARDCCVETYSGEGVLQGNNVGVTKALEQPPTTSEEEVQDSKAGELEASATVLPPPVQASKGKRQKGKNSQVSASSSPSPSPFNSTDLSNEPDGSSGASAAAATFPQLSTMKDTLDQLMSMQKELQKQLNVMVSVPITKEGRRLEGSLGRSLEKVVKANTDALWAHFQEENAKQEKLERDRTQQIMNLMTNFVNKDLQAMLEKILKKEIAAVGPAVARAVTQILEKTVNSAITECFQKGVGEKAVSQLEKSVHSKLEATVARQIQSQFQTSGKQALQDALRTSLEASMIPAFEMSCKNMFEQVDATLQRGLIKHTVAAQQQFESTHSPLAVTLRDAINSASTITRTLSGELADGQRKLLSFATAGANSKATSTLATQLSNGPLPGLHEMVEAPVDPIKELSRLVAEQKFEEAFTAALHRSDVSIVSWLCSQVDLQRILSLVPLPLSQGVLLALLQQLACDISNDTPKKLAWMTDVAVAINPTDPMIALHIRPIFEQVYQILSHHRNIPTISPSEASSIRLLTHVINSVLMSCK
ncbi:enhancer of mRNA-decapping protein 4 [Ziziphus jujuba]|uniref:Enhancer of mRNA-decapping protein 4 n=1 Tax=Ziziphus jujuba TaxID=326968 RepID=A0A6P4AQH3_ZIZJJ|nr:enhancer of mRNA-decapping protein 4 [Ziziphus jujuba]